jgi:hypothetical protein
MSLLLELPLLQTFGVMLEENIEVHESLIDVGKVGLSASFWRRVVGGIYVKNKQTEYHDANTLQIRYARSVIPCQASYGPKNRGFGIPKPLLKMLKIP